jgi:hypothetical protein
MFHWPALEAIRIGTELAVWLLAVSVLVVCLGAGIVWIVRCFERRLLAARDA